MENDADKRRLQHWGAHLWIGSVSVGDVQKIMLVASQRVYKKSCIELKLKPRCCFESQFMETRAER